MNISLVSTNYYMSGTYINFLDLQHYLTERKHNSTLFYTQLDRNGYWLNQMLKKTGRDYNLGKYMKLDGNVWIKDDIVITDFRGLVICKEWDIPFHCSKLLVIDSVELAYHVNKMYDATHWFDRGEFSYEDSVYTYLDIHEYDEIEFLMPNINLKPFKDKYPEIKAKEFYKKINYDVLKNANVSNNGKFCYRIDEKNLTYDLLAKSNVYENLDRQPEGSIFTYKGFIFHRRKRLQYWEQFGRLIFEYLMLGKEVRFVTDPFAVHDGLVDYIHRYGIIFDGERKALCNQENLIEEMSSDYEDLL